MTSINNYNNILKPTASYPHPVNSLAKLENFELSIPHFSRLQQNVSHQYTSPSNPRIKFSLVVLPTESGTHLSDYVFVQLFLVPSGANEDFSICYRLVVNARDARNSIVQEGKLTSQFTSGTAYITQINISSAFLRNSENGFLDDDKLTILLDVWGQTLFTSLSNIVDDNKISSPSTNINMDNSTFTSSNEPSLQTAQNSLLESFSDVTILVGGKPFRLHRNIIVSQSSVLAQLLHSQDCVQIGDIEVDTFEQLLRFLYSGSISLKENVSYYWKLLSAANKLQVAVLRHTCEQTLVASLTVESVIEALLLAEQHQSVYLKRACKKFITENAKKIKKSESWMQKLRERPDLLMELYDDIVDNWMPKKMKNI